MDLVCVVSGGGSGHEPAFCGLVGAGFLTGAVAGATFTSPPPNQILAALRKLASAIPISPWSLQQQLLEQPASNGNNNDFYANKHAGILVIALNYTGDKLNFGLAIERFRLEFGANKPIHLMFIGEDAALGTRGAGRRGLAGGIILLKVAGAMAESGKSLSEIVSAIESLRGRIATVGVSFGAVALPGSKHFLFDLAPGKMELGLGIHGEAGVQRVDAESCEEIVSRIGSLLFTGAIAVEYGDWTWNKGDKAVVLINNLGSISLMEMGIVCKYVLQYFERKGIDVIRLYCGSYLTSLDMAGFSVTLLKPGIETLHWLDEATSVPYWIVPYGAKHCRDRLTSPCLPLVPPIDLSAKNRGPVLHPKDVTLFTALTRAAAGAVIAKRDLLNELDSGCGDGDCGSSIEAGANGILSVLDSTPSVFDYPVEAFSRFATVVESHMGGTSGALYSLFFEAIATQLFAIDQKEITAQRPLVSRCVRAATEKIMEYGGARKGERTMVDVLLVLVESLEADQSCVEILAEADRAAKDTSLMRAARGRASYVTADLTYGREDAGARAVSIWIEAICKGACGYNETRV
ncbi:triokinase/FMN cyclase-like isoform X2 [Varroa jacobsoni]|uniref:triokinase/FMN cyclase-like isoform X2 n=1 Tax=Varroa jacobsoni TaxID=62625 RepID=UPI000BF37F12|nr:triokinase/FMN cyclase-like isoform X2 [Varroa jacobsoni]